MDTGGTRRWLTLAAGTIALTAGCTFQYGLAYLIPALRAHGLSLEQAGILVACPTAGLLLTLVAWGAAADRFGERLVLASGLAGAGVILLLATHVQGLAALGVCLVAAGAAGGSVYAASGRLTAVAEYAGPNWAGRALGIQNTGQNLLAAATPPVIAALIAAHGYAIAFATAAILPLIAAALVPVAAVDAVAAADATVRPG